MQSRTDNLPEILKNQLLACRARIQQRLTLFPESMFTVNQLDEWVAILQAREDEAGIADVFDAVLQAVGSGDIRIQDGFNRMLCQFIHSARILQLENYQLNQLRKHIYDYAAPEHPRIRKQALDKIERICSMLPELSRENMFDSQIQPLLDLEIRNWNTIKNAFTHAALIYRELMLTNRNEMLSLMMHYIDSESHDQRELVCSLLNKEISLLSIDEKRAIFSILDKHWEENKACRSVEQIIYVNSVWSDIPSREKKRFVTLIFNQLRKQITTDLRMTVTYVLPLQIIWDDLQGVQQLFVLRYMAAQSRLDGFELSQYHQFSPLILMRMNLGSLSDRDKVLVRSLFKDNNASFRWNSHWYRAFLCCASLFSESDVLEKLNELCDYIRLDKIDGVEYVDALKLLSPFCLRLSSVRRAKFIDKLLTSLGELSSPAVSMIVKMLIALLVPDMNEELRQIIFSGLLARPQHSLVDLCYRVCESENVCLNQEQWCQFIAASIDSFVQPHQSRTLIIEAIVRSFKQLIHREDKESVLSRLLDPRHDWKRERYFPCLLLRLHDALTHAQRDRAIQVVIDAFVINGDWNYEAVASHALMAVIPHLSVRQLMQILMEKFRTSEPAPALDDAHELYLRVFREYEARLLVKDNDRQSHFSRLPAELQDRIRDYLNPPVDRPPALAGINP